MVPPQQSTLCWVIWIVFSTSFYATISSDICSEKWPQWNAEFNVCNLVLKTQLPYYTVKDAIYDYDDDSKYEYYFNIGSPVLEYPSDLCEETDTGFCTAYNFDNTKCTSGITPITWKTWGYQQKFNADDLETPVECKHLSSYNDDTPVNIQIYSWLIEQSDNYPSEGIRIDMINGDYDSECINVPSIGKNTFFSVILECADDYENVPDTERLYHDPKRCWYWLKLKSIYGCPEECGRYDQRLCASNGHCGYDFAANKPKCQCFHGYKSDDCHTIDESATKLPDAANNPIPVDPVYNFEFIVDDTTDPIQKVTYDLSVMHLDGGDYVMDDMSTNWIYLTDLSVDGIDPAILPTACQAGNFVKPCKVFNDDNTCETYMDIGYGVLFRYNEDTKECQLLGTDIEYALYDPQQPSKGVTLTTANGGYCGGTNSPLNVNRNASFNWVCNNLNKTNPAPPKKLVGDAYMNDSYGCSFNLWYQSAIGCPWNCLKKTENADGIISYEVCSNHGTCLFDPKAGFTRCMCDTGYKGANCETEIKNDTGNTFITWNENTILLSVIVVLMVLLCITSLLCYRFYVKSKKQYKLMTVDNNKLISSDDASTDINSDFNSDFQADNINVDINKSLEEAVNVINDSPNSSNKSDSGDQEQIDLIAK